MPGLTSKRRGKEPARFVEPMQCLPVAKLPEGSNWEYEVKFDGYRALGIKSGGRVRLMSRNQNDLASRIPVLAQALAELPDETIIDGELVALDETGRPSFNVLQNYRRGGAPLKFYAFDVLTLGGRSARAERNTRTASNDADIRPSLVRLGAQNGPQRRPFRTVPRKIAATARLVGGDGGI